MYVRPFNIILPIIDILLLLFFFLLLTQFKFLLLLFCHIHWYFSYSVYSAVKSIKGFFIWYIVSSISRSSYLLCIYLFMFMFYVLGLLWVASFTWQISDFSARSNHILSADRLLGCFHFLVVLNIAVLDSHVQVCVISLGYITWVELLWHLYSEILKETLRLFSKVDISFYIPTNNTQHMNALISLHPWKTLRLSLLFIITITVDMIWYLSVVSICISLVTKDNEHLFMRVLTTYILLGYASIHRADFNVILSREMDRTSSLL